MVGAATRAGGHERWWIAAQVVRTVPRGGTPGSAPAITTANVPPILAAPPAANQITFAGNTLTIPD